VYTAAYPDGYSTDPEESRAYMRYCEELTQREIIALPEPVRALSSRLDSERPTPKCELPIEKHRRQVVGLSKYLQINFHRVPTIGTIDLATQSEDTVRVDIAKGQ
jgi:hypothetical protein